MSRTGRRVVLAALPVALLVLAVACTDTSAPLAVPDPVRSEAAVPGAAAASAAAPAVFDLTVTDRKDGDSFGASDGEEYRVGLVNTPEQGECGGTEASRATYDLLEDGFSSEIYARDDFGRAVARIATPQGDLGVLLAGRGLADDRYLEDFRDENPTYAAELDVAFALAREQGAGLHSTCWAEAVTQPAVAPPPPRGGSAEGCHPAYVECIPDGRDLDCAEIGHQVRLTGRTDPFRLDGNTTTATDGVGCDTFPPYDPSVTYAYRG